MTYVPMGGVVKRWWPVAVYAVVRVAIAVAHGPVTSHGDTDWYLIHPVSFLGRSPRPWVPALPMQTFGAWGYIVFQAALSGVAFCVLATTLGSTMRTPRGRWLMVGVVGLLGLSPRVTAWDAMVLSESLAISLTALLIAAMIRLGRCPVWVWGAVFGLWLLTREAHLYLTPLFIVGVGVWGWRQRRWTIPAVTVVLSMWGWWTYQNDRWAEEYNLAANIALHVGNDPDMFRWFHAEGMPPSEGFYQLDYQPRFEALVVDPEFALWVRDHGASVYARYLATHPRFLVTEPSLALVTNNARNGWSLTDHQHDHGIANTIGVPFWPDRGTLYTDLLILGAVLAGLVTYRAQRLDRRWVLPAVLIGSTWPHAWLVYHGAPWEVERHAVVLAFTLVVACWWTIGLAVDEALKRKEASPDPKVEGGNQACTSHGLLEPGSLTTHG